MKAPRGLERLYAVPPRDFTRARNTLAAELRAAGEVEDARTVAGMRRPGAALWAVNQLPRAARQPLERFLGAVDRLRRTQLSDPRGAMEAMRKEREQLDALVAHAGEALRAAGFRTSPDTTRRVSGMLLGAAVDREHAAALRAGRLTEEPPAPGFEALAGTVGGRHLRLVPKAPPSESPRGRQATVAERERARDDARAERQRERARQAEARQRAAEEQKRQAEERRREAERRAAEVAMLERDAKAARERLAEIDRRLSDARRAARTTRPRGSGGRRPASPT